MNLLSKIKTKLGLKPTSTGHILGTSSSSTSNTSTTLNNINNNEKNLFEEYYVTFNSISLGLTIISAPSDHPYYGSPMIQLIQQHSEGYQHIQIGDVILAIETNEGSLNYGDFIEIIKGLERPLTLKFARVPYIPSNTSKSSRKLTDDEKNNQREAMVNAALSREKAWEKRVNTASSTRRKKEEDRINTFEENTSTEIQNEEVLKSIEYAKRKEEQTIQAMGYNPFKPHFSSSNTPTSSAIIPSSSSSSLSPPPPTTTSLRTSNSNPESFQDIYSDIPIEIQQQLEIALQSLCDTTPSTEEDRMVNIQKNKVCLETIQKMLSNIQKNPNEAKFRCIRLSNTAFRTKIAEIEGGLEVMLCSGFILSEEDNETFLLHNSEESNEKLLQFTLHIVEQRYRQINWN